MPKQILMIAGPNGAGKTTMTLELMRSSSLLYEFINADEIARGLAPKHPESMALKASKLMIQRLKELLSANKSFAFETTASGTNYVKHLKSAKEKGYIETRRSCKASRPKSQTRWPSRSGKLHCKAVLFWHEKSRPALFTVGG